MFTKMLKYVLKQVCVTFDNEQPLMLQMTMLLKIVLSLCAANTSLN